MFHLTSSPSSISHVIKSIVSGFLWNILTYLKCRSRTSRRAIVLVVKWYIENLFSDGELVFYTCRVLKMKPTDANHPHRNKTFSLPIGQLQMKLWLGKSSSSLGSEALIDTNARRSRLRGFARHQLWKEIFERNLPPCVCMRQCAYISK